jgi:hypothetical protein
MIQACLKCFVRHICLNRVDELNNKKEEFLGEKKNMKRQLSHTSSADVSIK